VRTNRFLWFFVSILFGLAFGLIYGWMINPVTYVNTTPDNLRSDYKADYVLMVAEVYQSEQNVAMATRRLELLGDDSPVRQVQRAVVKAQELGYTSRDLETLERFSSALQSGSGSNGAQSQSTTEPTGPVASVTPTTATAAASATPEAAAGTETMQPTGDTQP
jgi:hypothetical protein